MAIPGLTEEARAYLSGNSYNRMAKATVDATTRIVKKDMDKINPTSSLETDPMSYRYISYPRDVTQDMANGHYMLFYVNVQNKSGYEFPDFSTDGTAGGVVEQERAGPPTSVPAVFCILVPVVAAPAQLLQAV